MLALRWADIDLDRGVVTISRGVVMGPDGLVEKDTRSKMLGSPDLSADQR
jgi:integrase